MPSKTLPHPEERQRRSRDASRRTLAVNAAVSGRPDLRPSRCRRDVAGAVDAVDYPAIRAEIDLLDAARALLHPPVASCARAYQLHGALGVPRRFCQSSAMSDNPGAAALARMLREAKRVVVF